jgi:predicted O-methyltransferase YrrM
LTKQRGFAIRNNTKKGSVYVIPAETFYESLKDYEENIFRNADAHQLVKDLPGPFDFVFIDADKNWYINYAKALIPKIEPGGCLAAHNVEERASAYGGEYLSDTDRYFQDMRDRPDFETRVHPGSRAGIAMSYKKRVR